jgi:hypothetical protein
MLWFYESFFPFLWIAFLIYWLIRAVGTRSARRLEPAVSRILRVFALLMRFCCSRQRAFRCTGSIFSPRQWAPRPSGWELAPLVAGLIFAV